MERVEISEVADLAREGVFHSVLRNEAPRNLALRFVRCGFVKEIEQGVSDLPPSDGSGREKLIELGIRAMQCRVPCHTHQQSFTTKRAHIENLVSNCYHAAKRFIATRSAKYPKREILDGEIALRGVCGL